MFKSVKAVSLLTEQSNMIDSYLQTFNQSHSTVRRAGQLLWLEHAINIKIQLGSQAFFVLLILNLLSQYIDYFINICYFKCTLRVKLILHALYIYISFYTIFKSYIMFKDNDLTKISISVMDWKSFKVHNASPN